MSQKFKTSIDIEGKVTASQGFSGNLTGNADTVTNGVYTNGDQSIAGKKTFIDNVVLSGGYVDTTAAVNKAAMVGNWNGANYWGFGSNGTHTIQFDMVAANSSAFMGASDINLKLGTNTVLHSGNYSSYTLPLSGGELSGQLTVASTGSDTYGGGIQIRERGYVTTAQSDWYYSPAISFHWGGRSVKRFGLRSDGQMAVDNNVMLHAGNYTTYSPSLTGSGASGTWGINITGNAATATTATNSNQLGGYTSSQFVPKYTTTLDLSGLDTGKWYPVLFSLPQSRTIRMRIENSLNSNVPSWSTHPGGFSLVLDWEANGFGWGTIELQRKIHNYIERFANIQICGGIGQLGNSSNEYVFLRGGGIYYFAADSFISTPTVVTTSYSYGGESIAPITSVSNDIWSAATGQGSSFANLKIGNQQVLYAGNYSSYNSFNSLYTGNWFRSTGASGWYSESYGGGIYMQDSTWVRVYGSKSFLCQNVIRGVDIQDDYGQSLQLGTKTISTGTTIDNSYHNCVVYIAATVTVTIPTGLRSDFHCVFEVIGTYTAYFSFSSGISYEAPFGQYLKNNLSAILKFRGTNVGRLTGNTSTS